MRYLLILLLFSSFSKASTCFGTTSNGRLIDGVQLPQEGNNFVSYSTIAYLAGRTYVHSAVKDIIVRTYLDLEKEQPNKVYKYAETGFKQGGIFKPHKTHRNGLSVDFITPVVNENGKSVHLPTNPLNRFGYDIEFNQAGKYDDYLIDYKAMAAHIMMLHKNAKAQGYNIWRVIFDPKLQPKLLATKYGDYLRSNIQFSKKRSWVRHDEHYHIDFLVHCK